MESNFIRVRETFYISIEYFKNRTAWRSTSSTITLDESQGLLFGKDQELAIFNQIEEILNEF